MTGFCEWLHMGGYSLYIWPAYGLACLIFIGNGVAISRQARRTKHRLVQWYKRHNP